MAEVQNKNVVVACRIHVSTLNLLTHLSQHTGLKKSTLLRAAISQWFKNAPEDLPLDLKIEIARQNIQHEINTIKNLRWIYHQQKQAEFRLEEIQNRPSLPPHVQQVISQLENQILTQHQQLDQWLKKQYQKGETP